MDRPKFFRYYLSIVLVFPVIFTNCTYVNPVIYKKIDGSTSGKFPIHGNWCGPDHPRRDYPKAIDRLDKACREHDFCYAKKNNTSYYDCSCDIALVKNIETLEFIPGETTITESINARLILLYMSLSPCKNGIQNKAKNLIEKLSVDTRLWNPVSWAIAGMFIGIIYLYNDILEPIHTDESGKKP